MAGIGRILVVGGGITSRSVAAALHRKGLTPEVVERSTAWPAIGAGINLPANGVRALRALDAVAGIERFGAVIRRWGFLISAAKCSARPISKTSGAMSGLRGLHARQAPGSAGRCCHAGARSTGRFADGPDAGR